METALCEAAPSTGAEKRRKCELAVVCLATFFQHLNVMLLRVLHSEDLAGCSRSQLPLMDCQMRTRKSSVVSAMPFESCFDFFVGDLRWFLGVIERKLKARLVHQARSLWDLPWATPDRES